MTWKTEGDRCAIYCDGAGCAQRVDALDFLYAAEKANRRGWYVPDAQGDAVVTAKDYCAACRPAETAAR